jgi:hypothetical protein
MASRRSKPKVDPGLQQQLATAEADEQPVGAVFTLRLPKAPPSPEQVEALSRKVIDHAAAAVGIGEVECNVFRNLGAFAVSGPPRLIRALLAEPEIATAVANRPADSPTIPPRRKRAAPKSW